MDNKAIAKKNIYQKLQEARVILQEQDIKKSGKNKFAGFEYYELKDFLPNINLILSDIGLTPVFNIDREVAELIVYDHDSDLTIRFSTPVADATTLNKDGKPVNLEIQSLGSQHTYLKRYLYLNALEIVEADSVDANVGNKDYTPQTKAKKETIEQNDKPIPKATDKQISLIENLYTDEEMEAMAERIGVSHISEINIEQASTMIEKRKGKS